MTKKILLFLCLILCYGIVNAAGSIDVSNSELSIKKGETKEFIITANNAAGLVLIKSSNEEIVTADVSKHFFDSEEDDDKVLNVKLTGIKEGTASVEVILEDVSSYDEEELQGTKILNITVGDISSESDPTPSIDVTPTPNTSINTKSEGNSKTLYFIIGGITLLLIIVLSLFTFKKRKNNTDNYFEE